MPQRRAKYNARIALAGILLLLLSQTLALLHSTDHFFHQPDPLCSIYQAVEHSPPGIINPDLHIEIPPVADEVAAFHSPSDFDSRTHAFSSRAPPLV